MVDCDNRKTKYSGKMREITRKNSISPNLKTSSDKKQLINIFWTGGFDSSYRMIQLSKWDVTIQPFYLCDNRKSEQNELNAISSITDDIKTHPETLCLILPLIKLKVSELEKDAIITEAYFRLHEKTQIGTQYEWLARFANKHKGMELCIEKSENGKAVNCIKNNGNVRLVENGDIKYFEIDTEKSSADLIRIFGGYHFPHPLFEITKVEMIEEYKRLGFEETILKTWFCHNPIRNEPCGFCNPCKTVIKDGLAFRMPSSGLRRYSIELKYGNYKWYIFYRKIRKRIIGY